MSKKTPKKPAAKTKTAKKPAAKKPAAKKPATKKSTARKTTRKTTAPKLTRRPPVTDEQIATRAYELFIGRGGEHGHHLDDWLRAESELRG